AHRSPHHDFLSHAAHPPELHREALELLWPASGLGVRARHLRHRPQAVEDPAGEAYLLGERLVDVDRVEVARRACVADGDVRVGGHPQLGPLALREAPPAPLTTL